MEDDDLIIDMTSAEVIDDRIEDLRLIAESKGEYIYNILFRNAGVGIQWHDNKKGPYPNGFSIHKYYPTLSKAITEEIKRLEELPNLDGKPLLSRHDAYVERVKQKIQMDAHPEQCTCRTSEPPTDMMMIDPSCPIHGTGG